MKNKAKLITTRVETGEEIKDEYLYDLDELKMWVEHQEGEMGVEIFKYTIVPIE